MNQNPYAPPHDDLPPRPQATGEGGFIEGGRGVEAGRGYAWVTEGWEIFKLNAGMWILVCLVWGLITIVLNVIPVVGRFAFALIAPMFSAGVILGCRHLREGRTFGIGALFEGFQHAGPLLIIGLVHVGWSLVLAGVEKALGIGAAIKPSGDPMAVLRQLQPLYAFLGISIFAGIPITMATYYAPALVALQGLSPVDAMKSSFLGAVKNILPFIVYTIVTMFCAILAVIPCGLGLFVLAPVMAASVYAGYRDVFFEDQPPPRDY